MAPDCMNKDSSEREKENREANNAASKKQRSVEACAEHYHAPQIKKLGKISILTTKSGITL